LLIVARPGSVILRLITFKLNLIIPLALKLRSRPFNLLALAAIILTLAAFTVSQNSIDLHLHDTYFVINLQFIFWVITALLLLSWVIYKLTFRILYSSLLSWLHIGFTLASLTCIIVLSLSNVSVASRRRNDFNSWEAIRSTDNTHAVISLCAAVLLLAQMIFIINIVFGIFRNMSDHR
jgi:hypothetical protein